MTIGAGFELAGLSFAGFGMPATSSQPSTTVLPDIATGAMQMGRLLNPATGDYTMTADGRVVGEATVPQLVKLALITKFRSACVSLGIDLTKLQMKGPTYVRDMQVAVSVALSDLVGRQLIRINQIVVAGIEQDGILAVVNWTDLTTNIPDSTNVGAS